MAVLSSLTLIAVISHILLTTLTSDVLRQKGRAFHDMSTLSQSPDQNVKAFYIRIYLTFADMLCITVQGRLHSLLQMLSNLQTSMIKINLPSAGYMMYFYY